VRHITIKCVITAGQKDVRSFAELPPSDITVFTEHTDVIFEVEEEDFPAHRRVLAMQSPVFKAELYGAMRENDIDRITIADIQPAVFEALLNFVYTNSLPALDDLGRTHYNEMIRHLLVAADRYAIDTLKTKCEGILSENIDVKTVLATLALADQHHCGVLNEACLRFIASLGSRVQMEALMASQEYAELKANCPLALVELWEKICSLGSRSKSSFHFGSSLA
jgi:speckle-type POZ protein